MTKRTYLRPTGLAVALAAGLGLITGTVAATAVYAAQPVPEPIVRTIVQKDTCYVGVATDAVEAIKLSGRQGIVLDPDNGEAYAYRLAECGK